MATPFNPKETSVVGYVNAQGETLLGIVNGVSAEGNPNLGVMSQVVGASHDVAKAPGTWHYLDEAKLAELQAPVPSEEPTPPLEAVEPVTAPAETPAAE